MRRLFGVTLPRLQVVILPAGKLREIIPAKRFYGLRTVVRVKVAERAHGVAEPVGRRHAYRCGPFASPRPQF